MRTILSVLLGIVVGAGGVIWLGPEESPRLTTSLDNAAALPEDERPGERTESSELARRIAAGSEPQRSAIYQVASSADERDLRSQIETLANGRATATQRFALGILFARYAELDPAGSIEALALLGEPQLAEAMALEVLSVIGIDDFNIQWVAAGLPGTDPMIFRVEAVARLARSAPSAALQLALLTESRAHRSHAVRRAARAWARIDPGAALEAAELIQDSALKNTMRSVVGQEWARARPETLLSYLGSIATRAEFVEFGRTGAVRALGEVDPQRLLELADNLPEEFADDVKSTALFAWSQSDPLAAYEYSQTLPPGQRRHSTQQQIGRIYGRSDPDAALLWLENLNDPTGELTNFVLQGIAEVNPELALAVAFDEATDQRQPWATQIIMSRIGFSDPERMPEVAEMVLALEDDNSRRRATNMLAQAWARLDGQAALEWALSRTNELPENVLSQIAGQFVADDPQSAMAYVNQVPPEARDMWIQRVAGGYARFDRQGALDWVGQYRGQDAYVPAVLSIVRATIRHDPAEAARLLAGIGNPPEIGANTMGQIVRTWAQRDVVGARSYTLDLPLGELRDAALRFLVSTDDNATVPDAELLAAFDSDIARQRAIVAFINNVARNDPVQARRLLDEHITSPAIRQEAEESIERRIRR